MFARDFTEIRNEHDTASTSSPSTSTQFELSNSETDSNSSIDVNIDEPTKWDTAKQTFEDIYSEFIIGLKQNKEDLVEHNRPNEPDKLSPLILKRDIQRCLIESHFYLEFCAGVWDFCTWKSPLATLCVFNVYLYFVWREMFIPFMYFLVLTQLGINFLQTQKNIKIGLNFLPKRKVPLPTFDLSGAQLIFDVARRAQNLLTFCADGLEKWRALFMWEKPAVTFKFVLILSFFFWLHVLTSINTFLIVLGFLIGGKTFIMTFLYYRFPRLRYMFDIAFYFYRHLPQNPHKLEKPKPALKKAKSMEEGLLKKHSTTLKAKLFRNDSTITTCTYQTDSSESTTLDSFTEISCFDCEDTELSSPVNNTGDVLETIRSCTLVDKNLSFSKSIAQGNLILTERALAFCYYNSKEGQAETIDLPYKDIKSSKLIKTFKAISRLIPGGSKGIQIQLQSKNKPLVFLRIKQCDKFYETFSTMKGISDEMDRAQLSQTILS